MSLEFHEAELFSFVDSDGEEDGQVRFTWRRYNQRVHYDEGGPQLPSVSCCRAVEGDAEICIANLLLPLASFQWETIERWMCGGEHEG